jgi:hypothetical protein
MTSARRSRHQAWQRVILIKVGSGLPGALPANPELPMGGYGRSMERTTMFNHDTALNTAAIIGVGM